MMVQSALLTLYGSASSIGHAQALLENLPQIKRIVKSEQPDELKLLLSDRLAECDLITLLCGSGIAGFKLRTP